MCQMMAVTISSSSAVGTTLNTASRSTDCMPSTPRSMTRDSAAGLPVEVEAQADRVQMLEGTQRQQAHRALLDRGEQRVADLAEAGRADAQQP